MAVAKCCSVVVVSCSLPAFSIATRTYWTADNVDWYTGDLPQYTKHLCPLCLTPRVRHTIKSWASKFTLYVGRSALLLILLVCGDVQTNRDPESIQDPCSVCDSPVRTKMAFFVRRPSIGAIDLAQMSLSEYYHWSAINDGWICQRY